ncbi:unnamed protein product [Rotaria sp. Silwood1]|nr:unnamed protein product [Rotaria sp. Silwood1]
MLMKILLIVGITTLVTIISIGVGILIGHFAIAKSQTNTSWKHNYITQQANPEHYKKFIDSIKATNIEANLKDLASHPHMAGLAEDLESAQTMEEQWKRDGLQVTKTKYNVLLSYPDDNKPNRITLTNANGVLIMQTTGIEKSYDPKQPKTVNPFLAYTPNGTVSSSKLFYANYGRLGDLHKLASIVGNESLQGSIIIMRYGGIYRGNKVMHAQYFGAVGAILYNDPANSAPFGTSPDQVYDKTWYMPPTGAQRGSSRISKGDPLTPIYPSTDYMYRVKEENVKFLPKIPAQPISYSEAQLIFQYMQGSEVISDWRGALSNVTYRYGGELVYSTDAWSLGAVDSISGTATLLEITRVIGQMYKDGFRPRRSLMFCSWSAEEYGLIGSVEYVQEYVKVLGARVVSYLNIDAPVRGNYTIHVGASPILFDIIVEASKMVSSAYDPPDQTIYDKWMKSHWNNVTHEPKIRYGLGSSSDFYAFNQLAGSSNFDAVYQFNPTDHGNIDMYPLYHTSYETFSMVKNFIDPDFIAHRTMAQFIGVLGLILCETNIVPFNVMRYTMVFKQLLKKTQQNNTDFSILQNAIDDFEKAAKDFVTRSKSLNIKNPYEIRAYNDQLLQLERAFLNPLGQGLDYPDYKHIIFAPAKTDQYSASGFPTINDALVGDNQIEMNQEIAIVVYFIRGALSILKQFDKFMT